MEYSKTVENEIDTINTLLPKLAKVYLKYEEAIDKVELKKMLVKKERLNKGKGLCFRMV